MKTIKCFFIILILFSSPNFSKAITLDFEDSANLGVSLGGHLQWNGTGGGHLFCNSYWEDDYLYFSTPTYVNSFKMNAAPFKGGGLGIGGNLIGIAAFDSNNNEVWSSNIDLSSYVNWTNWYTVVIEKPSIVSITFYAPAIWPSHYGGFWPSVDKLIINEGPESPVAEAGEDQTITFGNPVTVNGNGSSDPDGTIISYVWDFGDGGVGTGVTTNYTYLATGGYTVTLTVVDNDGLSGTDTLNVTVLATNGPPVANAGPAQTIELQSTTGADVTLDGSGSTDPDSTQGTNDDIVYFKWYEGNQFIGEGETISVTLSKGTHTVKLEVEDSGGLKDDDEVIIVIQDTTQPVVSISASPNTLWPPNGKMRDVQILGSVSDLSEDLTLAFSVTDEYGLVQPSISNFGDIIQLEASRKGNDKDGRIYTINVTATDGSSNAASASTTVVVPHNSK